MKKIVILGGGPAALSAAHELTRHPDWQQHYSVTIYQLGWTVGGKASSVRGPCNRIEEHGIHVMLGWYDHVFALMNAVYAERQARGLAPHCPYQTFTSATGTCNGFLLADPQGPGAVPWVNWPIVAPTNLAKPGMGPQPPPWVIIKQVIAIGLVAMLDSPYSNRLGPLEGWILGWFYPEPAQQDQSFLGRALQLAGRVARTGVSALVGMVEGTTPKEQAKNAVQSWLVEPTEGVEAFAVGAPLENVLELLTHVLHWLQALEAEWGDRASRDVALLELAVCNLRGILADVWRSGDREFDYEAINHLDYRQWLSQYGASENLLKSSVIRFFYSGTFSNLNDDLAAGGQFAAGAALQSIIACLGYKGSFVYTFLLSTGDTMIAPLYQVLHARGVQFEFFQRVTQVHLPQGDCIEQIDIAIQAQLVSKPYQPLISVPIDGGALAAWPAEPLWDQLTPQSRAHWQTVAAYPAEARYGFVPARAKTKTLLRGRDFDEVILAIPIAETAKICKDIVQARPRWQQAVRGVTTTATQAFQLWLAPTLPQLGLTPAQWGMGEGAGPVNCETYANDFPCWTDFTFTLPTENWPADTKPQTVAYFCGPMIDGDGLQELQDECLAARIATGQAKLMARQWLTDNMGWYFSRATTREFPFGLDFRKLVAPPATPARGPANPVSPVAASDSQDSPSDSPGSPSDSQDRSSVSTNSSSVAAGSRSVSSAASPAAPAAAALSPNALFDAQYFRANVQPWSRYTLCVPGSVAARMPFDGSGFANLTLAGDWVRHSGLNAGFLEGTVICGLEAGAYLRKKLGHEGQAQLLLPRGVRPCCQP